MRGLFWIAGVIVVLYFVFSISEIWRLHKGMAACGDAAMDMAGGTTLHPDAAKICDAIGVEAKTIDRVMSPSPASTK